MMQLSEATLKAIDQLQERPDLAEHARIVGQWIWIETPQKPDADARTWLKEHGYCWNAKRRAWQNSCGIRTRASRRYHPYDKYGVVSVKDRELS